MLRMPVGWNALPATIVNIPLQDLPHALPRRLGAAHIAMLLSHVACAIALDISPAEICAPDTTSLRAGSSTADMAHGRLMNNYSRPGGQQVRSVYVCLAWGAPC